MSHRHFIVHKPHGYLSQFVYQKKRNKKLLGELFPFPEGTMAIGRLDEDSEGLLLLTTDGQLSELIRSKTVEKEYMAQVDGLISSEAIEQLKSGVSIGVKGEKYVTRPCAVEAAEPFPSEGRKIRSERHGPTSWIRLVITEGKFRQIRKMTAAVGHPTLRLVRIRVGEVQLDSLKAGEFREWYPIY